MESQFKDIKDELKTNDASSESSSTVAEKHSHVSWK